jgi:hypothetical protein
LGMLGILSRRRFVGALFNRFEKQGKVGAALWAPRGNALRLLLPYGRRGFLACTPGHQASRVAASLFL